jgi:hypothetical protein
MIQKKENAGIKAVSSGVAAGTGEKTGHNEKIYIRTNASEDSEMMKSVFSLLEYFNGRTPVIFCSSDDMGNINRSKTGEYHAELCDTLQRELVERFGEKNVKIVSKDGQK